MIRTRRTSRRGAIAVVAAACILPMIGVMALAIDGGMLMSERRRAQVAADAAAYAAIRTYDKVEKAGDGRDPTAAASSAALAYAAASGFSGDGASSSVTTALAQSPGPSARHGGKTPDLAVEVVVTSRPPRLFSAIWGGGALDVSARTVAIRIPTADAAIIVLNPRDQDSLSVAGSARIVVGAEIRVKSSGTRAVNVNNAGYVEATGLKIVGGYQTSSGGVVKDAATKVQTGADPATISDPMEAVVHPTPAGLTARTSPSGWNATNPYPIYPGVYNGGLTLNSGGMNYTMAPGLYYIQSGGFTVSNGVRVTGSGVTIYLYDGNVDIQGGQGTTLSAPTNGTYQDVVIFQRSTKNAATGDYAPHTINIANGTNNKIQGTIYAPGAAMSLAGGSTTVDSARLIVNKLNLSNDAVYKPTAKPSASQAAFYLAR